MQTYDVIVVGNGLAGAALSYELAKSGQSVLLMDDGHSDSGTRYSYGGIGYWAGTSDLTETLFRAGLARHRELPEELGADTQLRELDLLLTVDKDADVDALKQAYKVFRTPPVLISAAAAQAIEPQLNSEALAGAFHCRHAHVNPVLLVAAYNQAFRRLGGHHNISPVKGLVSIGESSSKGLGQRVTGILTEAQAYPARTVVVAAGAYSRQLIQAIRQDAEWQIPLFFTHAEVVETPPLEIELRSLIMPAANLRLQIEAEAAASVDLWQKTDIQIMPPVLEAGVIQFADKTARIGQVSRFHTAYTPTADPSRSAMAMRDAIAQKIPALKTAAGTWRHCLVTFTQDGLPLVGPVPNVSGLHLFSGFTGPFALVPPLAQRYAQHLSKQPNMLADSLLNQMSIERFSHNAAENSRHI
jgi:glycine/D-amino acid oxidase-like deaminating enzyme